jgi:hypothetical protein
MANALTKHTLYFSDIRLEVECNCAPVNAAIVRDWGAAQRSILATTTTHRIGVHATTDEISLTFDDERVWCEPLDEVPADTFELILYRRMLAEHCDRFGVFHAAAVVSNGIAWVLCGPSGAGKSSLSVAALRRGHHYYTDEFVVTDGSAVWGWPRTPQFGPPSREAGALPTWLTGLGPPDEHGTHRNPIRHQQVARTATPADRVHFVSIAQGPTTQLVPSSPTAALQHWTEAGFFGSPVCLGKLVGRNRSWRAVWRHPDELLDALENATRGQPSYARAPGT